MRRTVAAAPHLRRVGLIVAIAAVLAIGFATLSPQPGTATGSHLCLLCGPLGGVNSLLNVFLFMPLGFGLALAGVSGRRAVLGASSLSAVIELAQLLVIPGRFATIGDVITNTIGGALGFAVGCYGFALLRPSKRLALPLAVCWCGVWLLVQIISCYGFYPAIPLAEYYGQIRPTLGDFEQFQGRVLSASIGNIEVPDAKLGARTAVRDMLIRGASFRSTIVLPEPISGVAPIVRVADASERELLMLAQDSADLAFAVRTGATVLRLRPPVFALADVIPSNRLRGGGSLTDTLAIVARYTPREAWLTSRSTSSRAASTANRVDRVQVTASLSWTVLMPSQWLITGTVFERVVSWAWVAVLLLPLGYWVAAVTRLRNRWSVNATAITVGLACALVLGVGLIALPYAFGLTPTPFGDWIAAVMGVASGGWLYLDSQRRSSDLRGVQDRRFDHA